MEELNEKEQNCLYYTALGLTSQAIAEQNHQSIHTVHTHKQHIRDKLGANNMSHALIKVLQQKLPNLMDLFIQETDADNKDGDVPLEQPEQSS